MSGIPLEPVYGPDDGEFPGVYPYTRGPYASMYRSKLWTMRMFAGFGTAEDTNWRFKEIIKAGGDGLSTAFDMPTLLGIDSDDPMALGEVGRCGVAIDSLADMEDLYRGLDVGAITTSMTINSPAAVILAMFVAQAEKAGIERARLGGTLQNDILKEYQAQKEFVFPPRPSMRLVRDTISFTAAEMPRWHSVSISGYHIREAGSTAAEELAFTLANGFAYVELALQAGLPVDAFAPRLSFFFNAHIDFFEEIAKYRAARRIWARWMRERYGAEAERSLQLRFHTQTAGVSLTAQQAEINIVRTAIEALAGVLGGTQSLHTNSMDEALALPTEKAARIALRTQQIIGHETNVAHVADPLGGSWFVEELTDEMERRAEELFAHLDELGGGSMLEGCIRGIEDNWFQGRIADSAYELERAFNEGRRVVVGVNRFTEGSEENTLDLLQITNEDEVRQLKRLEKVRQDRDPAAVDAALARLRDAGRRPRGQPHAGADRHRDHLRHPRRDDARPRRRLRPPHRNPHDLTLFIRVFRANRGFACGTVRHETLGCRQPGAVEARPARRRALRRSAMSTSVTGSICHSRRCRSRTRRASLACPSNVRCSGWMSSSMPQRTDGTARSTRAVRPFDARTSLVWVSIGIPLARSASASSTSGCDSLGAAPSRRSRLRRNSPLPGRAGWPSRRSMRDELVDRHLPLVQQLLEHREMIERPQIGREVEGEPGPGGRRRCRRPRRTVRWLGESAVVCRKLDPGPSGWCRRRAGPRSAAARAWACGAGRASIPAVGPVTNPLGCAAQSDDAALLERRSASTATTNTPLCDTARARRRSSRRLSSCDRRRESCSAAVVITPW